MKRFPIFGLAAVLVGCMLLFALLPSERVEAGIAGTKHDLSGKNWGSTQLCIFCHTPHNASASATPLWNHALTASTFTVYANASLNATVGQPDGNSKLCLSCHDGTVANDSFGANNGSHMMTGSPMVGKDLSNDHPISFTYDAGLATADGGLVTPASAAYVDAAKKLPLFSAKMQCATCHSVHDNTNGAFLRMANTGSAMCLTCHNK